MQLTSEVPEVRLRSGHDVQRDAAGGEFVLYWMTAFRRSKWNFALQRAADWSRSLGKPLVVLEALRADYPWASDRFHAFALNGMRDNRAAMARIRGVHYYPYLESARGESAGLLAALAGKACVVVGDDYPCFFLPALARAARRAIPCRYELVDSNGLHPLRATDKVFSRAFDFRRHLQKQLLPHLSETPTPDPLTGLRGSAEGTLNDIQAEWIPVAEADLAEPTRLLASLPIDHSVVPVPGESGGPVEAGQRLRRFLDRRLANYGERNQPEAEAASELSSHLHWGHISAHEVFASLIEREGWSPNRIAEKATGSSEGWWGLSPEAEGFLDELVTWREVSFNMASKLRGYTRYESLPAWAQKSLAEHESDEREHTYSLEEFEQAATHNELWNAAQRQLVREGRIHNYLRMLWGKKILHWSESPRAALAIMIELNNKYALDGRDPNSYSGIFWVLGRYDRAWGPERPIFGKVRYMTADNTARKVKVKEYLKRYAADGERTLF